jgi:hypothetical protein
MPSTGPPRSSCELGVLDDERQLPRDGEEQELLFGRVGETPRTRAEGEHSGQAFARVDLHEQPRVEAAQHGRLARP